MNSEITVTSNKIQLPYGQEAEAGVIEGIGTRPGPWRVRLFEPQLANGWYINITGPDGRELRFLFECEEQTRPNIRETINGELA